MPMGPGSRYKAPPGGHDLRNFAVGGGEGAGQLRCLELGEQSYNLDLVRKNESYLLVSIKVVSTLPRIDLTSGCFEV
jgi:hypothetical protein